MQLLFFMQLLLTLKMRRSSHFLLLFFFVVSSCYGDETTVPPATTIPPTTPTTVPPTTTIATTAATTTATTTPRPEAPSAGTTDGAVYVLMSTEQFDYPWSCRCDISKMQATLTALKVMSYREVSWNFAQASTITCSSAKGMCDPSNDAVNTSILGSVGMIVLLFFI